MLFPMVLPFSMLYVSPLVGWKTVPLMVRDPLEEIWPVVLNCWRSVSLGGLATGFVIEIVFPLPFWKWKKIDGFIPLSFFSPGTCNSCSFWERIFNKKNLRELLKYLIFIFFLSEERVDFCDFIWKNDFNLSVRFPIYSISEENYQNVTLLLR